jgi:TolB protein
MSVLAGCAASPGRGEQTPSAIPSVAATPSVPRPTATARSIGVTLDSRAPSLPGRLLFVSDANIWLLERGQLRRVTPDRISRQPAWSRDGQKIAHVKLATSGSDLWTMDADGSNSVELTDNEFQEDPKQRFALRPIWWPDGSRVLYLSEERSQDMQLWQLTVATRRRQPFFAALGDRQGGLDSPKLSPDGTIIVATSFQAGRGPSGRPQIWTYTLPNGAPRQLTSAPDGAYDPAWSPDGRRIAYTTRSGARHDIWVMRADGANARQVTTTGACRSPCWSPDGAWLAYYSAQSGTFDVWVMSAPPDADAAGAAAAGATPAGAPASAPATASLRQVTRTGVCEATSGLAWAP